MKQSLEQILKERVENELNPIDVEKAYDQMLDDVYGEINIGVTFSASRVLFEMDPTAYRCGLNDFVDSQGDIWEEIDGNYYHAHEVQLIRDELEEGGTV